MCGTGACIAAAGAIIYRAIKAGKSLKQAHNMYKRWERLNKKKIEQKNKGMNDALKIARVEFELCMAECLRNPTIRNICRFIPEDLGGQDANQVNVCTLYCAAKTGYRNIP